MTQVTWTSAGFLRDACVHARRSVLGHPKSVEVRQDCACACATCSKWRAGIPRPESEERWAAADRAIIGVWASKFNDRAYYSMRKVGLNFMDLRMAVLVQRVVPARYAFVIHTTNPSTGAPPTSPYLFVSLW